MTYTASVGVGSPATEYTLLIDIGSSNTWVGAEKKYKKTSTSKNTGKSVVRTAPQCIDFFSYLFFYQVRELWVWFFLWHRVCVLPNSRVWCHSHATTFNCSSRYGSSDIVPLAHNRVPEYRRCIHCSGFQWRGWHPWVPSLLPDQAIHYLPDPLTLCSIGPVDLTEGTIGENTPVPTITDNLIKQSTISTESIGIFYQPSTPSSAGPDGELTFGSVDSSKYVLILLVLQSVELMEW